MTNREFNLFATREVAGRMLHFATDGNKDNDVVVEEIVDEVIGRDCYGVKTLTPAPAFVLDGGACFGAFSLLCWALGTRLIRAFEPDPRAAALFEANAAALPYSPSDGSIELTKAAIGNTTHVDAKSTRHLVYKLLARSDFGPHEGVDVPVVPLPPAALHPALLKLDVEGAEREIFTFDNVKALTTYDYIVMEWHYFDGAMYELILKMLGYNVIVTGGDGTPWNPTLAGGILKARKKDI